MLQNITVDFVFQFLLIFVRIGTAFSMLPVLGDRYILMRIRLFIAATFSFLMQPLLKGYLPNYIDNFPVVVSLIGIEILIGLLITIGIKFYFQSISIVGQIIAMQSGLGSATFFDPTQRAQIAIFGNLLFLITTVSLLVSEVHHLFIQSIIDSYELFPTGKWGTKDMEDMNKFIVETLNDSFILAFKISAPFLVIGLIIMIGSGILSRLMPSFQVFFVITPAQILVFLIILYVVVNNLVSKVVESIMMITVS